jgi:hypothetical protein
MTKTYIYKGSCLCGKITYTVSANNLPEKMFFCHCNRCRKGTGSVHGANIFFNDAELNWETGETDKVHYQIPETRHARNFCKLCGSPVPLTLGKGNVMVPAGSLDIADKLNPTAHIQCKYRAEWEDAMAGIPRLEEY